MTHDTYGRLLMVRRANDPGSGLWSIPGGRVEPDEPDAVAVARELREETGLEASIGHLVGMVTRPAASGLYEIYDYECHVISGDPTAGDDAAEAAWIDLATFATLERTNLLTEELGPTLRDWGMLPRA